MSKFKRVVGVETAVGPTIMLRSGATLDFLDPDSSDFTIDDIAHGLSNICRYSGQCEDFYSVAEHSILVSDVAREYAFEALLHDAAEAFLGDITRPLKQLLPDFRLIEKNVERVILSRFGLAPSLPEQVKVADLRVLAAEQAQIMPIGLNAWAFGAGIVPADVRVRFFTPQIAKLRFLERFDELTKQRSGSK
ncbi:hypothetical protein [Rhizobium leguminosarum]|uniref:hypothetical protein n=1 Tax=Rhizobium leguminosarum TaxID=384 RepID=UPI003F9850BB